MSLIRDRPSSNGESSQLLSVANICVQSATLVFVWFADFEHKGAGLFFSK